MTLEPTVQPSKEPIPDWVELVRNRLEGLRYGVVQLIVHDGRVTQIDRTERVRLQADRDERTAR
jgi:hypothetical protein